MAFNQARTRRRTPEGSTPALGGSVSSLFPSPELEANLGSRNVSRVFLFCFEIEIPSFGKKMICPFSSNGLYLSMPCTATLSIYRRKVRSRPGRTSDSSVKKRLIAF